jgi:hypothetical protein
MPNDSVLIDGAVSTSQAARKRAYPPQATPRKVKIRTIRIDQRLQVTPGGFADASLGPAKARAHTRHPL